MTAEHRRLTDPPPLTVEVDDIDAVAQGFIAPLPLIVALPTPVRLDDPDVVTFLRDILHHHILHPPSPTREEVTA